MYLAGLHQWVWEGKGSERKGGTYTTCTVLNYEYERAVAGEVGRGAFIVEGAEADAVLL